MPTTTNNAQGCALIARSSRGSTVWRTGTATVVVATGLPENAIVESAVFSFSAGSPICGSYMYAAGQKLRVNAKHSIEITVENGQASVGIDMSFTPEGGAQYIASTVMIDNCSLTVTYHDGTDSLVQAETFVSDPISLLGTTSGGGTIDRVRQASAAIAFDGVDITDDVSPYLLQVDYTDNEEDEADDIQIKLQDTAGMWLQSWLDAAVQSAVSANAHTKGTVITAALSVSAPDGTIRSSDCGEFQLDSVKAQSTPSTITIKGTSIPYGNGIRSTERDKAWESCDLQSIGGEIAQKAGLRLMFDSPDNPYYSRVEQAKQTDLAFLQELCHNSGKCLKVAHGRLIIFDQATYEAKAEVSTIERLDGSYTKYDLTTSEGKVHYAVCEVRYTLPDGSVIIGSAKEEDYDETASTNKMLVITDQAVYSKAEAEALAAKLLKLRNKFEATATFTMVGNPLLNAGLTIRLKGFGMWDGLYMIRQAKHTIGSSGYTTKLTLRQVEPGKTVNLAAVQASSETAASTSSGSTTGTTAKKGPYHWEVGGQRVTLLGSTAGAQTLVRMPSGIQQNVPTSSLKQVYD